jgi:hypothetical protein
LPWHLVNNDEDGKTIWGSKTPISLHGYLLLTHKKVQKACWCIQNKCSEEEKRNIINQAEKVILDLGKYHYDFIELSKHKLKE